MKQFNLSWEPLEKKREFLRKIYALEILYSSFEFNKRGEQNLAAKSVDSAMTLERFLELIDNDTFLKVHTDEDDFIERLGPKYDSMPADIREKMTFIRIHYRHVSRNATLYADFMCPHNQQNYGAVKQMVSETFGRDLEAFDAWQVQQEQLQKLRK